MGRILSLDIGDKYIGLAMSDPLGYTAQPYKTYKRVGQLEDLAFFKELVETYDVEMLLSGLPLSLDGTESKQTRKARNFAGFLKNKLELPLVFMDERLTTEASHEILYESGMSGRNHKKVIDTVAAQIILQDYLEDQRMKKAREERLKEMEREASEDSEE